MSNFHNDAGIPLLTEVIAPSTYGVDLPERRATPRPPMFTAVTQQPVAAPAKQSTERSWNDDDWRNAEEALSEKLLLQLMGRIDFVLEQRVRDSLNDVVHSAVETMSSQLRSGLNEMLEDALSRALTQELAKLKNQKITGNHS